MKLKPLIVAGVMSGTSADGIDVAVVRIAASRGRPKLTLLAHEAFRLPCCAAPRSAGGDECGATSTAELARLNWRLGMAYARAVKATAARHDVQMELIGCHGQTLYHQARAAAYAGKTFACTWQAGEAALIAAEMGVPVVSNFRPADMAAGGQGAPLVPLLDLCSVCRSKARAGAAEYRRHREFDSDSSGGRYERQSRFRHGPRQHGDGCAGAEVVWEVIRSQWRDRGAGPSARFCGCAGCCAIGILRCGRRRRRDASSLGASMRRKFLADCRRVSRKPEDALATATALTAESIARSYRAICVR